MTPNNDRNHISGIPFVENSLGWSLFSVREYGSWESTDS